MTSNVTFPCQQCQRPLERPFPSAEPPEPCPQCNHRPELSAKALVDGKLKSCPVCGVKVLYRQKDFNQAIGCVVVVIAAALAPFTFYISLVVAALIDLVLYWIASEVVICYGFQCRAHLRGLPPGPWVNTFELSIHDFYKSLANQGDSDPPPAAPSVRP